MIFIPSLYCWRNLYTLLTYDRIRFGKCRHCARSILFGNEKEIHHRNRRIIFCSIKLQQWELCDLQIGQYLGYTLGIGMVGIFVAYLSISRIEYKDLLL